VAENQWKILTTPTRYAADYNGKTRSEKDSICSQGVDEGGARARNENLESKQTQTTKQKTQTTKQTTQTYSIKILTS